MNIIKLILKPGKAKPNSRLGSSLGPFGINIGKFCLDFNNLTKKYDDNIDIPVRVYVLEKGGYKIFLKKPTLTSLIKKYLNIKKGGENFVQKKIFMDEKIIKKIISIKKSDFNTLRYNSNRKTVISCAKSIGLILKSNSDD